MSDEVTKVLGRIEEMVKRIVDGAPTKTAPTPRTAERPDHERRKERDDERGAFEGFLDWLDE